MPGSGTKQDITTSNPPPARVLDLTRLASRAGRRMTGIDRVEYAYARALSATDIPCFGLVRTALGYVLVRPDMIWPIVQRLFHGKRAAPDLLSRLARAKSRAQREAETEFRRAAHARCRPRNLARMLQTHLPSGFAYINVGHSNLTDRVFDAVRDAGGVSRVMVHDVIPLEHPNFQRAGTPDVFEAKMKRVWKRADLIIYNSQDTQARTEAVMQPHGDAPVACVALLGVEEVEVPNPVSSKDLRPPAPYFMCLGTIEPRKNIGFLLDIWDDMGPDAPGLLICGARGWNNETVFNRLNALPPDGPVRELSNLSDGDIAALMQGSNGLLFPSLAEGFGLPAVEAARLGVPILCNDLAIYRETLADIPIYASVTKPYLWISEIRELAQTAPDARRQAELDLLTWDQHFKVVLNMT